ncbi:MAG: UvrD-helicase domain-containing protein [Deltaproteobacteria bacterium]|nr:UvrD-helicase domain-containing protein [Deltaproteobacteria bacterium]
MTTPPADERERRLATTTFDRNVVVTAGAGTGKTTLLVERCVNLLMRPSDPVQMTELVALTFTNKAANEMKARLRDRLEVLAGHTAGGAAAEAAETEALDALRERFPITADDIRHRARQALSQLERAQIGTIHSFAAALLRLYPLETGLDPQFREDDGSQRKRLFATGWALWLDQELSGTGPGTAEWKRLLGRLSLDRLGELALALCAENVDLDALQRPGGPDDPADVLGQWLRGLEDAVNDLIRRYPKQRKFERALAVARKVIRAARDGGAAFDDQELSLLGNSTPAADWSPEDSAPARDLVADARALARVDPVEIGRLCALLVPFARRFREDFARGGLVTFDGLLVRARDLLRDHPRIRAELKGRFKAILVDEFQDTDPLQYEILLWLCEERSGRAANWRDVRLEPGKVFVVGDPKQSIYGFRGADIAAYLQVVKEVIQAQDGVEYRLTANFRSDARILNVVNGVFDRLIREEPGLQPEYIPLQPGLGPASQPPDEADRRLVRVRRVTSAGATPNADGARRLEAESLARWLEEEVLGRAFFDNEEGNRVPVRPGHVAFLMRTLGNVQLYLEALRRRRIGYVVEGERDFYAAQEVIDAINLLRAIDNPHDRLALVGVLRSPVGGYDDAEIFALGRRRLLDYRAAADHRWVDLPPGLMDLYQRLSRLHGEVRFLEAGKAVERVFKELPLSVLAASRKSGQQAVANLEKVRLVAGEAGADGSGTLKDVVAELERRVRDEEAESENALEEETLDAVRIMSIHRAKGLEFPVVVLVDALAGVNNRQGEAVEVRQDWATGLAGIRVDDLWSLPGVFLRSKQRERERYERRRLLYVAMTRPRQQLVVSFAERGQDRDSIVAMVDEATGGALAQAVPPAVTCGMGEMAVEGVEEDPGAAEHGYGQPAPPPDTADWSWYEDLWRRRRDDYETRRQTPLFLTPSRLKAAGEASEAAEARPGAGGLQPDTALVLGSLAHQVLEHWDFQTTRIEEDLDEAVARHASGLPAAQKPVVVRELKAIWATLAGSPVYEELQGARILGREMPFVLPWGGQVMEGRIDLVYEREGRLYVADYKTDQVTDEDLAKVMHDYRHQARVYTEAVRSGLNREVAAFRLILLRLGRGVDVPAGSPSE